MNNKNINLTSLIRLLIINLKTTFIIFTLVFLFFLSAYFSFFKTQNYKYMLSTIVKPMSYIEFTKIFTFSDVEVIIKEEASEKKFGSDEDKLTKRR